MVTDKVSSITRQTMKNKKEKILAAAEEEFAKNGYEGANMCRIAKKVGVTHVLLYYHFQNKENLFRELLQQKIEAFIQSVLPPEGTENLHFMDNIDNLIGQNFDFMAQNAMLARLIVNETCAIPESLQDIAHKRYNEYLQRLQHSLDVEAEKGNIVPTNAEQLMQTICSLNIMSVLVMPAIANLLPEAEHDNKKVLQRRKEENIQYIHTILGVTTDK